MPKPLKDYHEGVPYHLVKDGKEKQCYQLHKPKECRLKFPLDNEPIHLCGPKKKQTVKIEVMGVFQDKLIPSPDPNYYPTVVHKNEFERLKKQARIVSTEEQIATIKATEAAVQKEAKESEKRKRLLKEQLLPQPGANVATGGEDPELEAPDQAQHTLTRGELLKADQMQGPRLCNRIILASKCHAIRDAQMIEKTLMKKELSDEEKRLDDIMEENRLAAIRREDEKEAYRLGLRLHNLTAIKDQIRAHETAKIMEAERIEEESIRLNQANIAMQMDEAEKLKEKHHNQLKLKEMLDQGNNEILYYKQLQMEEDRITDLRIAEFLKQKQEREDRNRAEADAVQAAKMKGIAHIANAQKAEQQLKDELDRIRNLKIQEDVEREYRRKERDAAIKRHNDMKVLHEARMAQISEIHRTIAREIAKDEQLFNNAAKQNEEFLRKEKERQEVHKGRVEKHRQEIMKQINDKERGRIDMREKIQNEGVALRLEQDQQDKYEMKIIQYKLNQMRQQKVPEKYVKEVEQILGKYGYKV